MTGTNQATDPLTLDPDLDGLVNDACVWLVCCAGFAVMLGANVADYITSQTCGRVASGYYPEAERRATRALSYSNSLPVVS